MYQIKDSQLITRYKWKYSRNFIIVFWRSLFFEIEHLYWIVRIQSILRGRSADMWVDDIVDIARTGREAGYKWYNTTYISYLHIWAYGIWLGIILWITLTEKFVCVPYAFICKGCDYNIMNKILLNLVFSHNMFWYTYVLVNV